LLIDNLPGYVAYMTVDDLRYRFVNRTFAGVFGWPQDQIVGMHPSDVIGERNVEFAAPYLEQVRAGQPSSYENVFDTERGKRWIQVNYVPDFDAQGQVVGTVLLGFDVTERRQQEETLQAYSERLEERVQERTAALQEAQEQLVRREKLAVRIFRNMATSGFTNCPSHERLDGASGAICLQTQYTCLRLSIVALPNALRAQALRLSADLPSP
jgi:PAS domain S-box-containing protein